MNWSFFELILWAIAGAVSLYFSLSNARVWTSIAVGFVLILFAEIIPRTVPLLPGIDDPYIAAMGYIISTIAILVMTHGFMEYYVFSRTLELEGEKWRVYAGTGVVIIGSVIFLSINPLPTVTTLRTIHIVEHTCWVFLSLINIDMIRKIYLNVRDTPIAGGFIAFAAIFASIFLWKGAALYIEVYQLDTLKVLYGDRLAFSQMVSNFGNILASVGVGGTFIYLARLLR